MALVPENTLMGLLDELQLMIVRETLGPQPSIPLDLFNNQTIPEDSILFPFTTDKHLFGLALDICYREGTFTTTIDELRTLNVDLIPLVIRNNIRHLRIIEPRPLPFNWSRNDTTFAFLSGKFAALERLSGRLPSLRRIEVHVLPDLTQLWDRGRPGMHMTLRPILGFYYAALLAELKRVRARWFPEVPELRITVLNSLMQLSLPTYFTGSGLAQQAERMASAREEYEHRDPVLCYPDAATGNIDWNQMMSYPLAAIVWRA